MERKRAARAPAAAWAAALTRVALAHGGAWATALLLYAAEPGIPPTLRGQRVPVVAACIGGIAAAVAAVVIAPCAQLLGLGVEPAGDAPHEHSNGTAAAAAGAGGGQAQARAQQQQEQQQNGSSSSKTTAATGAKQGGGDGRATVAAGTAACARLLAASVLQLEAAYMLLPHWALCTVVLLAALPLLLAAQRGVGAQPGRPPLASLAPAALLGWLGWALAAQTHALPLPLLLAAAQVGATWLCCCCV